MIEIYVGGVFVMGFFSLFNESDIEVALVKTFAWPILLTRTFARGFRKVFL